MEDGLRRMYGDNPENVIYYMTVYNEPMSQPAEPENVDREGILRGHAPVRPGQLRGPRRRAAARAAARLRRRRAVGARGAGAAAQRLGRRGRRLVGDLVDRAAPRRPGLRRAAVPAPRRGAPRALRHRSACGTTRGPVVAVSDYMRQVQDQIQPWVPGDFASLGADGFGFSDTRPAARRFFHIDGPSVAVRALQMLAEPRRGRRRPRPRGGLALPAARRHRRHLRQRRRRLLTRSPAHTRVCRPLTGERAAYLFLGHLSGRRPPWPPTR